MIRNRIAPLAVALIGTALAHAQAATGKVGVINIQSAIVTTKDGQKAAAELDSKAAPKRKTLEAKQNEINGLKDQMQKGSNALSDAAKQEIARNIDSKTKLFNRDMQDAQDEVEQDQQKVLQDLGGRIMAVIDKYAKDNGFVLILDVSSPQTPVMFASNTIDVTKDIIDLYDKAAASGSTNVLPGSNRPVPGSSTPQRSNPGVTRPPATSAPATPATPRPKPGTSK